MSSFEYYIVFHPQVLKHIWVFIWSHGLALQDNQLSFLSPCSTVLDDGFPKDKSRKTII